MARIGIGTIWDRTTAFASDRLGAILPIAGLAIFLPQAISGSIVLDPGASGPAAHGLRLLQFVLTVVGFWGQLAIVALVLEPAPRAARALANRRFLPAVGVMCAILLALVLLWLPLVAILMANGVDLTTASAEAMPDIPPAAAAWTLLYAVVLLPVLLCVGARLIPTLAVVLAERRGLGAIGRAWRLTRGSGAKLAGLIVLYAVISLVLISAVTFVVGGLLSLLAGGGSGPVTVASVLTAVVVAAVATVLSVLQWIFTGQLYLAAASADDRMAERAQAER